MALSRGYSGRGVTTTHPQLVLKLRMSGAESLLPTYALTARARTLLLQYSEAQLLNKSSTVNHIKGFNRDCLITISYF